MLIGTNLLLLSQTGNGTYVSTSDIFVYFIYFSFCCLLLISFYFSLLLLINFR